MIKKDFLCMCASQTHYKMHQNINMNKFQMYQPSRAGGCVGVMTAVWVRLSGWMGWAH